MKILKQMILVCILKCGINQSCVADTVKNGEEIKIIKNSDKKTAEMFFNKGRDAYMEKKYDIAKKKFIKSLNIDKNNKNSFKWLARIYGDLVRENRTVFNALKLKFYLEQSIKLDPKCIESYIGLVEFYAEAPWITGGSMDKAYEYSRIIKRLSDKHYLRAYGVIAEQQGKYKLAEISYKKFLDNCRDGYSFAYAWIYLRLGDVCMKQGSSKQAMIWYEKGILIETFNKSLNDKINKNRR